MILSSPNPLKRHDFCSLFIGKKRRGVYSAIQIRFKVLALSRYDKPDREEDEEYRACNKQRDDGGKSFLQIIRLNPKAKNYQRADSHKEPDRLQQVSGDIRQPGDAVSALIAFHRRRS